MRTGTQKEIKMGKIQLPPYLWFSETNSTPVPKGLAGEVNSQSSTSRDNQHNSTPDLRQRGLAGEIYEQPSSNLQHSTPDFRQRELAGEDGHTNINITKKPLSPVHNLEPKRSRSSAFDITGYPRSVIRLDTRRESSRVYDFGK